MSRMINPELVEMGDGAMTVFDEEVARRGWVVLDVAPPGQQIPGWSATIGAEDEALEELVTAFQRDFRDASGLFSKTVPAQNAAGNWAMVVTDTEGVGYVLQKGPHQPTRAGIGWPVMVGLGVLGLLALFTVFSRD